MLFAYRVEKLRSDSLRTHVETHFNAAREPAHLELVTCDWTLIPGLNTARTRTGMPLFIQNIINQRRVLLGITEAAMQKKKRKKKIGNITGV